MNICSVINKKRFWVGVLFAQILLFFGFSRSGVAVSFFEFLFEWKKSLFQFIFSKIPFSVGDVFYFVLGIFIVYFLVKIFSSKAKNIYFLRFLKGINIFYLVYQCFWGMTYFQTPIIKHLDQREPSTAEIKALAIKYLNLAKNTRTLVKENKNGVFTIENPEKITAEIIGQQKYLPAFLANKKPVTTENLKPSLYSYFMNYTGVLGYYNPFTTEAQYNSTMPDSYIPFTLSHEFAHQLGLAREQEANFVAYLLGKNSENLELKYSTEYYVLKSLLNALIDVDEPFVKSVLEQYSAGMKRDRQAEKEFVLEYQGFMNDFFSFTNDLFLKSNQQDGSITYSYFVDLLIRYERTQ